MSSGNMSRRPKQHFKPNSNVNMSKRKLTVSKAEVKSTMKMTPVKTPRKVESVSIDDTATMLKVKEETINELKEQLDNYDKFADQLDRLFIEAGYPDGTIQSRIRSIALDFENVKRSYQELKSENEELKYLLEKAAGALKGV